MRNLWQKWRGKPMEKPTVVRYYIAFSFGQRKHPNSPIQPVGTKMSMVEVRGGITTLDEMLNVKSYLENQLATMEGVPNPMVIITQIHEMARYQEAGYR